MTRKATSSNEGIAKASAGSSAAVGTHTLQVKQLASSQYVTGGKVSATADTYNRNTKLTELGSGVSAGTIIKIVGKEGTVDEKTVNLEVTGETTVDDFLKACKSAGLNASFDTTQQRFFISSANSGKSDAFSITTSALSDSARNVFDTLASSINTAAMTEAEKTKLEDAFATLRHNTDLLNTVLSADYDATDKKQKAVYDAIETVKNASVDQYAEETARQTVRTSDLAAIAGGQSAGTFELYGQEYDYNELRATAEDSVINGYRFRATGEAMRQLAESDIELGDAYADPTKVTYATASEAQKTRDALAADGKLDGLDVTDADALAQAVTDGTLTQAEADALKIVNTFEYTGTAGDGTTIDVQQIYGESYNASLASPNHEDAVQNAIYESVLEDHKEDYEAAVAEEKGLLLADESNAEIAQLTGDIETVLAAAGTAGTVASNGGLASLGLGEITSGMAQTSATDTEMAVVAASNAVVVLDGATMEETKNNFTVNGLTLDLVSTSYNKDTGEYDSIQITVGNDTDSIYNMVKEALTEYNNLIEEMNKLYYADSARKYEPLTSEQKEAMSDDEIEKWETKIKDSLLRRDDTLYGILSGMRSALNTSYTDEDGNSYTLSSFGIVTGNYTERGKLHLYGDAEDSTYATYGDRLKAALEEDPDKVMNALTSIFGNLYSTLTEKCAKTELSSALTFYNDKQYSSYLSDYEDALDKMNDKIANLEERYYKQFTQMETALSKLQNQTNALAAMLGTNTNQ